ncbi:MAG: PAS domain S-box protein [Chitinispirillaceae bacterium]|nr:PAS domain S-box protein [Chitinispirillaceae bacterium]
MVDNKKRVEFRPHSTENQITLTNANLISIDEMRAIFNSIMDGIAVTDLNGVIIAVNESLLKKLGYNDNSEIAGKNIIDFVLPCDRPRLEREFIFTKEKDEENTIECTVNRADGSFFPVAITSRFLRNNKEDNPGVVFVVDDITERRLTHEDAILAEGNFRKLLDDSPFGAVVVDRDNNLLYTNKSILDIFGFENQDEMRNIHPSLALTPDSYVEYKKESQNSSNRKSFGHVYEISIKSKNNSIKHLMVFRRSVIWEGEIRTQYLYFDITENRESEELHRILADNSPAGIYILQDNKLCYSNTKFQKISGYTREELTKIAPDRFIHPDDQKYVHNAAQKMLDDETSPSYEFRFIDRCGEVHWVIESVNSIYYNGKRAIVGNITDITQQKKDAEEHDYSKVTLRAIHDGVYAMNTDFVITRWNSICEKIFDVKASDVVGKHIWEVIQLIEEYPQQNAKRMGVLLQQGFSKEEQRYRSKDGKEHWLDVHAESVVVNGEHHGWITIFSDISKRKQMENELKSSEEYLRSLIESMDDIVFTYDLEGRFSSFYRAPENVISYIKEQESETIGKKYSEILDAELSEKMDKAFKAIIETGQNQQFDYTMPVNGRDRWYDARLSPVRDSQNNIVSIVAVSRDISERKEAEKSLVDSEETMRSLVNSLDDFVFTYDLEGRFEPYFKLKDYSEFGPGPDPFLGRLYKDYLPADVSRKMDIAFEAAMRTGETQQFDYSMAIERIERWFDARVSPIRDSNSQISRIMVTSREISDRIQMEKELIESESKIRTLINSLGDIVFTYDLQGNFTEAYYPPDPEIFSTPQHQYIGQNFHEILPDYIVEKLATAFDKVKTTRQTQQFDYWLKFGDQTLWFNAKVSPLVDGDGHIIGFTSVNRDITGRKIMEDKIEEAAREWEATFDSMSEEVYIIDRNYRVLRANKGYANSIDMEQDEIIGKHCYKLVHNRTSPCVDCSVKEVIRTKKQVTKNIDARSRGKHLQGVTSPIFDDEGNIVSFVTSTRDISEIKKIEVQLQQSQLLASLGTMTAGIAHEVNNPLGSILLLSELLLKDNAPDAIKKDLRIIHSEAKRAAKIMSTLLTYRKRTVTNNRRLNLNRIIKKVMDIRQYRQSVLNINQTTVLPQEPLYIRGDYSQLVQVFINVVINAEEALRDRVGGNIQITAQAEHQWVKIEISDNGCGISNENLDNIFHPFFTTKNVGEGTGLGLSTSYSVITSHNGLIRAENNESGGAKIIIELPLIEDKKKRKDITETVVSE